MVRVLVLDNDQVFSRSIHSYLKDYFETRVSIPARAVSEVQSFEPNVVLVCDDIRTGEFIQSLRQTPQWGNIGVIMLFDRLGNEQFERAYRLGADNAMEKPLKLSHLQWAIRYLHQRETGFERFHSKAISWNGGRLDSINSELTYEETTYVLTPQQGEILHLLMSRPDQILTRDIIKSQLTMGKKMSSRSIDAQISKLKKAVGEFGKYIQSVYGKGYLLSETERKKAAI